MGDGVIPGAIDQRRTSRIGWKRVSIDHRKVKSSMCICREATIIVGIGGGGRVEERGG